VLEDAWKTAPESERGIWRSLAQLAVGLTHAARGNPTGATALLRRAATGLAPYGPEPPHGIDAAGLSRWARQHADLLSAGELPTHLVPPRLLRTPPP
jgi:predicted metal-dependent hydrolase